MKNDTAAEFMKPALKNLLEIYLKIMEDIDSEALLHECGKLGPIRDEPCKFIIFIIAIVG